MNNEQVRAATEMVDLMGVKPNGETVLLGKVAMPPRMKAKELIRELIGGDFEDDSSDAAMWLYAFERFIEFMESQRPALATTAAPECSGKLADELLKAAERVQTAAYNFNASKFVLGSAEHHAAAHEGQGAQDALIRAAIAGNYGVAPEADSSSAAPSDEQVQTWINGIGSGVWANGRLSLTQVELASVIRGIIALAAPSPTGESLNAGLIAPLPTPAGCPKAYGDCRCDCHRMEGVHHFLPCCHPAALATPRQTSDPAAEDERLSKRIGATKGALASALRRPCVVKLEPGSSPSPFDPVFTTVTLDAEIPPPHQTEDGSGLSAATVHAILVKHLGWVGGPDWHDEAKDICSDIFTTLASTFTPKENGNA